MDTLRKSKIPLFLVRLGDSLKLIFRFFIFRKPFTAKHTFQEPFFIIGSGRSGNTLLRSMLVAGEEVNIPPESYVWPRIIRIYATYNFLPWEKLCGLIISEFEAYKEFGTWEVNLYEAHQNARKLTKENQSLSNIINKVYNSFQIQKKGEIKRWGDKTPINTIYLSKIIEVFPKAQFVHIFRDPKDVVCSYVNAGLYKNHEDAAKFWKASVDSALKLKKKLPANQFHQIRYEDLVSNPKSSLKTVSEFLEIHYSKRMLDFWKLKDDLGDVKKREHHKNIGNPVSTASVGKWKKQLSKQEQQQIEAITKNTFQNAYD